MQPTQIDWVCRPFSQIPAGHLLQALAARQDVFICEQACLYRDIDGLDPQCWHVLGHDPAGRLAAYARILPPGLKYDEPSVGRVLTQPPYRGVGLGKRLLRFCLDFCAQQFPGQPLRIAAQHRLRDYYRSFGFSAVGPVYDEDGILHIDMVRVAD